MTDQDKNDRKPFIFERWADEEYGWDQETGAPGIESFGNAVQVWSVLNSEIDRKTSVAEAVQVFNVEPRRIVEAVENHSWMVLTGPEDDFTKLIIEHDGE